MYRQLPPQRKIVSPIQRPQLKAKQPTEDAMASLIQIGGIMKEIQGIKSDFETWYTNKTQEVQKAIDEVQKIQRGERGFVGPKGDKGDSIVGPAGPRGERGEKGDVGDMPVAGLDFPFPKDGKDGKDGKDADPQVVVEYIKKLPVGKRFQIEHIDGLKQTIDAYGRHITEPKWRGGGDTVVAGTGVTITRSFATGKSTISVTGVSSTILTATGTINDFNTTFTFTSQPSVLVINGAMYASTGGAITWTYAAGTVTLSSPVGSNGSIFGIL